VPEPAFRRVKLTAKEGTLNSPSAGHIGLTAAVGSTCDGRIQRVRAKSGLNGRRNKLIWEKTRSLFFSTGGRSRALFLEGIPRRSSAGMITAEVGHFPLSASWAGCGDCGPAGLRPSRSSESENISGPPGKVRSAVCGQPRQRLISDENAVQLFSRTDRPWEPATIPIRVPISFPARPRAPWTPYSTAKTNAPCAA